MKKGEIWLVELPTTNGHEQEGYRPAMVLAEAEANIAIIVPFTSNLQALRFPTQ
ncbi:type II toxin-antitoxin system PemK/MazF family toxin [Candidatus Woesearchaeota archaeon]|nr:type II toxin-antitoxin system PemK/MazF family toxin [Candidatus Woesearchaeota archaeon]